jgi:uncharacterized protein (UPF0276 family)
MSAITSANFSHELALPISTLFRDDGVASQLMAASDCLECRDRTSNSTFPGQKLFHSDFQPIHKWSEKLWTYFEGIASAKGSHLELISFHCASCCDKPILKEKMFHVGGKMYSREEMRACARGNFKRLRKLFGDKIKIAIENNNYYPTEAYQDVCQGDFISSLCEENDLYFLFDIAHAKVSAINLKIDYEEYRNTLPLDRAIQVHICSHDIDENGLAFDAHNAPDDEVINELGYILKNYPAKYLTVEYYRDKDLLIESIKRVRSIL